MSPRLKKWWDEYHYLITMKTYNPLWFLIHSGHNKSERIYRKKSNKQWERIKFLKDRLKKAKWL